jgi:hypothetical protein
MPFTGRVVRDFAVVAWPLLLGAALDAAAVVLSHAAGPDAAL